MTEGPTINYVWRPQLGPQHALMRCPCEEVFYGGARGGGKTDGVLGKWAWKESVYGEHFNAVGVRQTTVSWEDAIDRSRAIFGPLGGKYNEVKMTWRMPHGGKVRFSYLESVADADKEQGKNLTDIWVEEAGLYPTTKSPRFLPAPIARLKAALRSAYGVPKQMILTGNPGGPGQQWNAVRYRLIPFPRVAGVVDAESESGHRTTVGVIPARLEDNRRLLDFDPSYESRLNESGSAALVKAWRFGDYSAVEGAYFDCWDERRHVVEAFDLPGHWLRFLSMDWGFASPHSVGWWAVVGDDVRGGRRGPVLPRGCLVRYREWYGVGGSRLTAEEIAAGILERESVGGERRDLENLMEDYDVAAIAYGVIDPSAFAADGGPSIAERMARSGVAMRRADNKRVRDGGTIGGWDQMRNRLVGDGDGNPMVVCFSSCVDSIRTIPVLQHDPDRLEDLDTASEDHAADDWRYACMSRPWTRVLPDRKSARMLAVGPGNRVRSTIFGIWSATVGGTGYKPVETWR